MSPTFELVLLGTAGPVHSPHRFGAAQVAAGLDAIYDGPITIGHDLQRLTV